MKIAVPVNAKSIEAVISKTFGRTEYFLIYDTASKACSYIDNQALNSQSGAGIKAAQLLVDYQVEALITPQCGENAAKVLQPGGVSIYKTSYPLAVDNIIAFQKDQLALMEHIHGGFHGSSGGN